MSLLVGTVIQSARAALPDPSGTLPVNSGFQPTAVTVSGSTLFTSSSPGYFITVTNRNPWGETNVGTEWGPLVVDGTFATGNAIQVVAFAQPGATFIRVYLTQPDAPAGSESVFVEQAVNGSVNQAVTITISAPPANAGTPPARNSAYNPDTDGYALSAGQMYTWLNEALSRMSRTIGGVLDYSGVGTVAGQPYYTVMGQWLDIASVWVNGYWVQGDNSANFWKRNPVLSSIISRVAVSVFDDRVILELGYQPDRNAGTTILTSALGPTDTSATVANPGAFLLTNGFCQIGTEICAYSGTSAGSLGGLVRRLGGTSAESWPMGTTVLELNMFFQGRRILDLGLEPGDALETLPIPAGYCSLLTEYIVAKYRSAEQDYEEQRARLADFDAACRDMAQNKTLQKFVQVGGSRRPLTFNNTVAGGLIIP